MVEDQNLIDSSVDDVPVHDPTAGVIACVIVDRLEGRLDSETIDGGLGDRVELETVDCRLDPETIDDNRVDMEIIDEVVQS